MFIFVKMNLCFYRVMYESMVTKRDKGRHRNSKDSFSLQQLQNAQQEYEEEATLFVFRLQSLRQGQSRSLLTQAVRHHSSQVNHFPLFVILIV